MKPDLTSKNQKKEIAKHLFHDANEHPEKIAEKMGVSTRTIYRWIKESKNTEIINKNKSKRHAKRPKKYPDKIFDRISELKTENPARTAVIIQKKLEAEFQSIPSCSTIRKYLAKQGFGRRACDQPKGYIRFERKYPNDLWQVDIAGVQTVGHLGKLYLFAFLDDCSRFIPAAFYAKDEKGTHVFHLIREAMEEYGKPNQILADNGTQFSGRKIRENCKFARFLNMVGVKPIYSRVRHPQTKGKLERWFGTVKKSFLAEARFQVKEDPSITLKNFNQMFGKWLHWYNFEKKHRSLPSNGPPAKIYLHHKQRIYRPFKHEVNWDLWTCEGDTRKVLKTNFIHFRGQKLKVPPGYGGMVVNIYLFQNRLDIYYHEDFLITHELPGSYTINTPKKETRLITTNGTIGWKGKYYSVNYKLAGKEVKVKESNDGQEILIYLGGSLIRTHPKK